MDLDTLIDRRRLKRRLSFWRIVAFVLVIALIGVVVARVRSGTFGDHIARITIDGIILEDRQRETLLRKIADNDTVKGLIVRISSPGGTTTGSEVLYQGLRQIAENKPVVAVIGTIGASGGYMAALAADHIIARETTITGSIGVILQTANFSGLMEKVGVDVTEIKSGPLKGQPSPFGPLTEEAQAATQSVVDNIHDWFTNLVAVRRNMPIETVRRLADGRIYTGRQALDNALIDELGGEAAARAWMTAALKIPEELPVVDVDIRPEMLFLESLMTMLSRKIMKTEWLTLDGLVSLWQP